MKETLQIPLALTGGTLWPASGNLTLGSIYYYTASSVTYAVLCTTAGTIGASTPTEASGAVTTGGTSAAIVISSIPAIQASSVAYADNTAYAAGKYVTSSNKIYYVGVGGTTGTAAPTGTTPGAALTVGTATMYYIGATTSTASVTGVKWGINTSFATAYTLAYYGNDVYIVLATGSSVQAPSPTYNGVLDGGTLRLQYLTSLTSKVVMGFDSIATVEILGTSSLKVIYALGSNSKTLTVYLQNADSTYESHYLFMSQFNSAFTRGSGMYNMKVLPKLPNNNFVSATLYA